jgi:tetratricopeptide (TPR) repeat protein
VKQVPTTVRWISAITDLWLAVLDTPACIWDSSTTLSTEKRKSPKLAEVILNPPTPPPDPAPLLKRIDTLKAAPKRSDPAWWNDLAGAYLRLGRAREAADLLAQVVEKFPNDYGIHANLGTVYHLLGRYAEAEKHIARNLEINPDAHFGLEKYHLALLQYLSRDTGYQLRHVFVDEFTGVFLGFKVARASHVDGILRQGYHNSLDGALEPEEQSQLEEATKRGYEQAAQAGTEYLGSIVDLDWMNEAAPKYRAKFDLGKDTKLEEGVIYMATLNTRQPACFVMLGLVALKNSKQNLAAEAFERAIQLESPQAPLLKVKVKYLREYVARSLEYQRQHSLAYIVFGTGTTSVVLLYVVSNMRKRRRTAGNTAQS